MTATVSSQYSLPPAVAALEAYPWLRSSVETSLRRQTALVIGQAKIFRGHRAVLAELVTALREVKGGLVALEGQPGSGVTTLLAYLAATQPWAFWFCDDDAGQGATLLHAQLIALHDLSVPLVAPSAGTDPVALEVLLDEIASRRTSGSPVVLLIDPPGSRNQPREPFPPVVPARVPPNVVLVYGCTPGAPLPLAASARVALASAGSDLARDQAAVLRAAGCPEAWIEPVVVAAQGNFLYLRLAYALLRRGKTDSHVLKPGVDTLHDVWWQSLDPVGRRLALILAAAGDPLPAALCSELLGVDARPMLAQSEGWVDKRAGFSAHPHYHLHHWSTREYLARRHAKALAQVHADIAMLSPLARAEPHGAADQHTSPSSGYQVSGDDPSTAYLLREAARHAALGTPHTQALLLPRVTQRGWIRAHERANGTLANAARDLAWELRVASRTGPLWRLVRSAVLAGTLAALARSLSPDAALSALSIALERGGRESGLKRVLALVDQLPDGQARALVLRQLGEACYSARMRTSAMRLLSQALDLEEQKTPRVWREQREQLHAALASAALHLGEVEAALEICARIEHIERRGMAETNVIRWLLEHGDLTRARGLANAIAHESLGAWARAEVAVALSRAGERQATEECLAHVDVETAYAWAQIELACDDAAHDEEAAYARINRLESPTQRDRGLTRLAHALALADKDGDALHAAGQINDVAVRVSALLDLRLTLEGLVAMLALEQATSAIETLTGDVRIPLVASLAAAHAALGRRERAIGIAQQLAEGEERDRALSRVAVALARWGDYEQGKTIAHELTDDDERDWTLDELTRILAGSGRWQEAQDLGQEIRATELRARTLAELAIARARADDPVAALQLACSIPMATERVRALTIIAPVLIAADHIAEALAVSGVWTVERGTWKERSQSTTYLPTVDARSRYLAAVVTALAEHGNLAQAHEVTAVIPRPVERARAYLAIARAAVDRNRALSRAALGTALRSAVLGRAETFRLLEQAAPVLALLEGAPVLTRVAAIIDEIDTW